MLPNSELPLTYLNPSLGGSTTWSKAALSVQQNRRGHYKRMVRALSSLHKLAAVKRLVTSGTDYWLIQPTWFITYDRSDLFAVKHLSVIGFNTKALLSRSLTLRVSTIFSEIAPEIGRAHV